MKKNEESLNLTTDIAGEIKENKTLTQITGGKLLFFPRDSHSLPLDSSEEKNKLNRNEIGKWDRGKRKLGISTQKREGGKVEKRESNFAVEKIVICFIFGIFSHNGLSTFLHSFSHTRLSHSFTIFVLIWVLRLLTPNSTAV